MPEPSLSDYTNVLASVPETSDSPLALLDEEEAAVRQRFRGNSLAVHGKTTFIRRKGVYSVLHRQQYKNSLLVGVGFLELFNALDFPANVWNDYPLPSFVTVLMGLGGGLAMLGPGFALWDLLRSKENVSFLWGERKYLKAWRQRLEDTDRAESACLVSACMDINLRELGWELVDRLFMDALLGFGGLLVGIGTLMAIYGIRPEVFRVSNILSGYLGNSFGALYVLVNLPWSTRMLVRANQHKKRILQFQGRIDPVVRRRVQHHARRHQVYALINGVSVFIAGIAGMISATMWQGYVVLIPCIVGSLVANLFWRHKLGYNRDSIETWIDVHHFDIFDRLKTVGVMHDNLLQDSQGSSEKSLSPWKDIDECTSAAEILDFTQENGLYTDYCQTLLQDHTNAERVFGKFDESLVIDDRKLLTAQCEYLVDAARTCIKEVGRLRFRDEERFLLELLGCYVCAQQTFPAKPSVTNKEELSSRPCSNGS